MEEKIYNYFYLTVNLKNGHFYHGIHSTDDLNDGYKGSGTVLQKAFEKHKKSNFVLIPLKFFDTRKELENYEAKVVNKEFLKRYQGVCYNVAEGGHGGDLSAGKSDEEKAAKNQKVKDSWSDPEAKQQRVDNIKKSLEDPEKRKSISEKKTEHWSDQKRRDDISKKMTKHWSDQSKREELSKKLKGNPKLRTQLGKKPWNAGKTGPLKGKKRHYREDGSYYYE